MTRFRIEHVPEGGAASAAFRVQIAACHALRNRVFVDEQRVAAAREWDGLDARAEHFLARRVDDGEALGTARLRVSEGRARAERVAVHAAARRSGVGRVLMEAVTARARVRGCAEIELHAQLTALPFYEALGYVAEGPVFDEAGIDHRSMRLALPRDERTGRVRRR